jgi:branched-chain amino acid transport system ATP-binding protein
MKLSMTREPRPPDTVSRAPVLELRGISAAYGDTVVLRTVDLTVQHGGVVALLGPNGAGKSTLLRVASGLIRPTVGQVLLCGESIDHLRPSARAAQGLCLIPEGRGIFRPLTVRENLRLQVRRGRTDGDEVAEALELFPNLKDRLGQIAGTLSGGQQQMLALARAFLSRPAAVLLDEVSMGLAPVVVEQIFSSIRRLASTGVSLLLVEQYVTQALQLADHVVVLYKGEVAHAGPSSEVGRDSLVHRYLGGIGAA